MNMVSKEALLLHVKRAVSVGEIAKKLGVEKYMIWNLLRLYQIPTPLAYRRSLTSKQQLKSWVDSGWTLKAIADQTRLGISQVIDILDKHGLQTRAQEHHTKLVNIQQLSLSPVMKGVIIGTMLGDSWIQRYGENHYVLGMQHSIKQRSFLRMKAKVFLRPLFHGKEHLVPYKEAVDRFYRSDSYRYLSIHHEYLKVVHSFMYSSGEKEVTEEILKDLTALGIAVWFGDDGSKNTGEEGYYFHTNSFSLKSIQLLREHFYKQYAINTGIIKGKLTQAGKRQYNIRVAAASVERFEKYFGSYIVSLPGIEYKYGSFHIKNPQRLYAKDIDRSDIKI